MKIKGYPGYSYIDGVLINPKGEPQKLISTKKGNGTYKVKRYDGKWVQLSRTKMIALAGERIALPETAKEIPGYENYYIDVNGDIYSFSKSYPSGKKMTHKPGSKGYPQVKVSGKTVEVHSLLARTFIMEKYIERGFCVLHLDNDKSNCHISNIEVGTYSRNNKQAYRDGLNPGNGLRAPKEEEA